MATPKEPQEDPEWVTRASLDELIHLGQPARLIRLARTTARALQSGQYLAQFKGRGMEFDETRPYAAGDDIRSLDWRVTARTGKVHTKLFREERERPVFLSVDLRPAMFFATRGMFKSALAARLAALMAWSSLHHGDRLGGQILTAEGHDAFKPAEGHAPVLRWLKALSRCGAATATTDLALKGLDQGLNDLSRHVRPGSLVFVISDFRGLSEPGCAALSRLARHSTVVLMMLSDPFEKSLPVGFHRYGSPGNERILQGDEKSRQIHLARFETRQEAVRSLARQHRMRFVEGSTEEPPVLILRRAFRIPTGKA